MARTPKPKNADATAAAAAAMAATIEAPAEVYVRRSEAQPPVPGRTRVPDIGAACHDTRKVGPAVRVGDAGSVAIGPTESGLAAKQAAYDKARRANRH